MRKFFKELNKYLIIYRVEKILILLMFPKFIDFKKKKLYNNNIKIYYGGNQICL